MCKPVGPTLDASKHMTASSLQEGPLVQGSRCRLGASDVGCTVLKVYSFEGDGLFIYTVLNFQF